MVIYQFKLRKCDIGTKEKLDHHQPNIFFYLLQRGRLYEDVRAELQNISNGNSFTNFNVHFESIR